MAETVVTAPAKTIVVTPTPPADAAPLPAAPAEAPAAPAVGGEQPAPAAEAAPPAPAVPEEPKIDAEKRRRFVESAQRRAQERREREEALAKAKSAEDLLSVRELIAQGKYLEAARKLNIPYDKLTDQILSDGREPTPEERIARLEAEREAERKQNEERQKTLTEQVQRQMEERAIASTRAFLEKNAETFPLLAADEGADLIYEAANQYVNRHGLKEPIEAVLTKAAKAAEDALQERAERLEKALQKKRPAQPSNAQPDKAAAPTAQGSRTLTNRVASEAPAALRTDDLPLDPDMRTKVLAERFALSRN